MVQVGTYRLEGLSSVCKVQSAKEDLAIILLVALKPALGQNVPLGLELCTHLTAYSGLQSRQQDSSCMIPRSSSDLGESGIIELDVRAGLGLLEESIVRRLFGSKSS